MKVVLLTSPRSHHTRSHRLPKKFQVFFQTVLTTDYPETYFSIPEETGYVSQLYGYGTGSERNPLPPTFEL